MNIFSLLKQSLCCFRFSLHAIIIIFFFFCKWCEILCIRKFRGSNTWSLCVCVCVCGHEAAFVSFHLICLCTWAYNINNGLIVMQRKKKLQIIIAITPPNAKQMHFSFFFFYLRLSGNRSRFSLTAQLMVISEITFSCGQANCRALLCVIREEHVTFYGVCVCVWVNMFACVLSIEWCTRCPVQLSA